MGQNFEVVLNICDSLIIKPSADSGQISPRENKVFYIDFHIEKKNHF